MAPAFENLFTHQAQKGDLLLYIQSEAKAVIQDRWVNSHNLHYPAFHCGLSRQRKGTGNFEKNLSLGMPKPFLINQSGRFEQAIILQQCARPVFLAPLDPT